ncbi:MAG: hypothetical protein M1833_002030 [Piccolia ochrophora]|nr:MAG: hypothetical protein M1833_002030 [Piccolia ochrophora]
MEQPTAARMSDTTEMKANATNGNGPELAVKGSTTSLPKYTAITPMRQNTGLADFFSTEVFYIVLHNPTTARQILKFSQTRFCGENMEFLDKVNQYHSRLDDLSRTLADIHQSFTAPEAPRQINVDPQTMKNMNANIKALTTTTFPAMERLFGQVQEHIERLLYLDVYPRFVRNQMTLSATKALSGDRSRYQGLGDCFCLTSPAKADNPIVYASDGFVSVTGYTRQDIIPRNCRFLQGKYTDPNSVRRLKEAIEARVESVELLLNYRKNGDPFWNLLYVAPLYNSEGIVKFFLGGQINCSTTIHSCSDILRVLSASEDIEEDKELADSIRSGGDGRKNFLRNLLSHKPEKKPLPGDAGMEQGLLNHIEKKNLSTQMKMFYTAYSKYLVISYPDFEVKYYSQGIIDLLYAVPPPGTEIAGKSIFKFLGEHSALISRDFKSRVKSTLRDGAAISHDVSIATRRARTRAAGARNDESIATHWTPLKDEHGAVAWVVLTLSSRILRS